VVVEGSQFYNYYLLFAPAIAITMPQVNLIVANEITPHLTAEEYLDKGEYENELKQVILVSHRHLPEVGITSKCC
jgi:hypothetical protein